MSVPFYKTASIKSRSKSWIADCIRFEYDIIAELEKNSGEIRFYSPMTKNISIGSAKSQIIGNPPFIETKGSNTHLTHKKHIIYFPGNRDLVKFLEYKNLRPENLYSRLRSADDFVLHIYDPFARFKYTNSDVKIKVNENEFDLYNSGIAMFNDLIKGGVAAENVYLHGYSMGGAVATAVCAMCHRHGFYPKLYNERSFSSGFEVARYFLPELLLINYSNLSKVLTGALAMFSFFIKKWIESSLSSSNFSLRVNKYWDNIPNTHKTCVIANNLPTTLNQILMKTGKSQFFPQKTYDGIIAHRASIYFHEKAKLKRALKVFIDKNFVSATSILPFSNAVKTKKKLEKKLGGSVSEIVKLIFQNVFLKIDSLNNIEKFKKLKFSKAEKSLLINVCLSEFENDRVFAIIRPKHEEKMPAIRGHDYSNEHLVNMNGQLLSEHIAQFLEGREPSN